MTTQHANLCRPRSGAIAERLRQDRCQLAASMAERVMSGVGKAWSPEHVRGGSKMPVDRFLRALCSWILREHGFSYPDIAEAVNGARTANGGVQERIAWMVARPDNQAVPRGLDPAIQSVRQARNKAKEIAAMEMMRHYASEVERWRSEC